MKELSIEQKAKAYDEAIERANELNYVSDTDSLQRKTVEHIFPELKESEGKEDEKIKKAISDILLIDSDEIRGILEANGLLMQDIDAWLEKQGKRNLAEWKPSEEQIKCLKCAIGHCRCKNPLVADVLECFMNEIKQL